MEYLSPATAVILEAISTFFFIFFILCLTFKLALMFFDIFTPHKDSKGNDNSVSIFFNDKENKFIGIDRKNGL